MTDFILIIQRIFIVIIIIIIISDVLLCASIGQVA